MGKPTSEEAQEELLRAGAQFESNHREFLDACGEEPRDEARIVELRSEAARSYERWRVASFYVVFGRKP